MINYKILLESMYGIAYLVDRDGVIIDYSEKNWNNFARENDSPVLLNKENVLGHKIYEFIEGEETKKSYREFNEILLEGKRESINFYYRCDSPEYRRDMKMCISAVKINKEVKYLLYHSIVLSETLRPPMNIFSNKIKKFDHFSEIITVCSYCKSIKTSTEDTKNFRWLTPEEYYRSGGKEDVMLSHGICPTCYENIVFKFVEPY